MRKSPARASSKYLTLSYVAGSLTLGLCLTNNNLYEQDISQLGDECNTFVEKIFDNSGHTFSSFFLTKVRGQGQCDPEAVCGTP